MNCVKPTITCQYRLACNPSECSANICQKTLDNIEDSLNILIALQQPAGAVDELLDNITPKRKKKS
jgi:hypothetical protein